MINCFFREGLHFSSIHLSFWLQVCESQLIWGHLSVWGDSCLAIIDHYFHFVSHPHDGKQMELNGLVKQNIHRKPCERMMRSEERNEIAFHRACKQTAPFTLPIKIFMSTQVAEKKTMQGKESIKHFHTKTGGESKLTNGPLVHLIWMHRLFNCIPSTWLALSPCDNWWGDERNGQKSILLLSIRWTRAIKKVGHTQHHYFRWIRVSLNDYWPIGCQPVASMSSKLNECLFDFSFLDQSWKNIHLAILRK